MAEPRIAGRDSELAAIRERLTGLARGHGALVWIEGEPGIGKSALVRAALSPDRPRRWRLFQAAGDEFTQLLELQRRDADAREVFVRAVAVYEDLGAHFDVRRIRTAHPYELEVRSRADVRQRIAEHEAIGSGF